MNSSLIHIQRRRQLLVSVLGLGFKSVDATERLKTWPSKSVKLVVPFAAGGTTDLLGRALAQRLSSLWKQPVVIENLPGGGTSLAAERVSRAAADGHTLMLASTSTLVIHPLLSRQPLYDVQQFSLISMLATAPMLLMVPGHSKWQRLQDFLQEARDLPGKLNFGSPGYGSSLHLAMEILMAKSGVQLTHIPFSGSQPALTALVSGEIQAYFDLLPSAKPFMGAGRLRAIATTARHRMVTAPDIPTFFEQGLDENFVSPRFVLIAPGGLSPNVVQQINLDVSNILSDKHLRDRFEAMSLDLEASSPEQVNQIFSRDREALGTLLKQKNIRLEN